MLEPCTTCGEATERGTCAECRQTDRARHKTARAQAILSVGGVTGLPHPIPYDPVIDGPILTADQVKHAGTAWIDKAYQQQRLD